MKKIFFITILALITSISGFSQSVNSYKYVIVPNQYEFLKGADQYQLNSLTKFLFNKYGFEAYLEGEKLPSELSNNRCKALTAFVTDDSGLFSTKLYVGLKDCNNNEVFISEEGMSRTKEFKQAYHEALREAFQSVSALNYSFDNSQVAETKVKAEAKVEKVETPVAEVVAVPAVNANEKPEKKEKVKAEEKQAKSPKIAKEEKIVSKTNELSFVNNGDKFYLKKSDKGYNFFQDGMAEPFAALISSNKENSFIYSSITNQGVAYFQENGDLVVEILDRSTNSTNTKTYSLKD